MDPKRQKVLDGRMEALRAELERRGLDGFIVPRADEHQGEYVAASSERLAWLTGFTGSAGLAIVLDSKAALFVDGRYTVQAREQVDTNLFSIYHLIATPPHQWLAESLQPGLRLGFDPWLHTFDQERRFNAAAEEAGASLEAVASNSVDAVWRDRPEPPRAPARPHPLVYAGIPAADKRRRIADFLRRTSARAAVLTLPDSIAWLLNVRGGDVPHTPLVLSFALLHDSGAVDWFVDESKVDGELRAHLGSGVTVRPPEALGEELDRLAEQGTRVQVDPATAPAWIFHRLRASGSEPVPARDPCIDAKAVKNEVELAGTRAAHLRDGRALTCFLAWLDREAANGSGRTRPVDEIEAAERLLAHRREGESFQDLSFDTISGAGPNGAIVHYRVDESSNRPLGTGELYLVDSGGQYLDGTTDVTRTVAIGSPSAEMKRRFTLVLKGHIALARARFPKGTTGSHLDALARYALWLDGLDYDHGTGHGVGSYLSVHEGPQRISRITPSAALEPGMVLSNEPGYYKEGAYGIRIENLVTVVESPARSGEERDMLAFDTLTLAPIDRNLIETGLLSADERSWIDDYHAHVRQSLSKSVDAETRDWLEQATAPLR